MTQSEQILLYLKTGARLTPIDALQRFGCFRLAARVADLRGEGHDIRTDTLVTAQGKRVAEYRLA